MLKAYEYVEYSQSAEKPKGFWDQSLREKEIEISKRFCEGRTNRGKGICPVCGADSLRDFYQKWNVQYERCGHCNSVLAVVDSENMEEYRTYPQLSELRRSENYQKSICARRKNLWEEQLDWMSFRCYRYLDRNEGLRVIDYGNRYRAYMDLIRTSKLIGEYELRRSLLVEEGERQIEQADVVLCMDYLQQEDKPKEFLCQVWQDLKPGGLLILSTRVGGGFDILALRENNPNVFPYEHILLPSKEGLRMMLEETNYEVLEMTTPGALDIYYVLENRGGLHEGEYFLQYLTEAAGQNELADFQRFLQKSGMSSYAQVIARKVNR